MSRFFVDFCFVSQYHEPLQWNSFVLCFGMFPVAIKFMDKNGGEYQHFPSKNFCLTVPRNFVREPSSMSLVSAIEKNYAFEGYVKIFCREHFVSQYQNFS